MFTSLPSDICFVIYGRPTLVLNKSANKQRFLKETNKQTYVIHGAASTAHEINTTRRLHHAESRETQVEMYTKSDTTCRLRHAQPLVPHCNVHEEWHDSPSAP